MKTKLYIYILAALSLGGLIIYANVLSHSLNRAKQTITALEKNERVLLYGLDTLKAKNGTLYAKTEALSLSESKLKKYNSELTAELKNLRIRVKDLESTSQTIIDTDIDITTPLRDTIIIPKVISKAFDYKDPYVNIWGVVGQDSIKISYQSTDTLRIFHYYERKKFLFFRWGIKSENWIIKNNNPNNRIAAFNVIQIEK